MAGLVEAMTQTTETVGRQQLGIHIDPCVEASVGTQGLEVSWQTIGRRQMILECSSSSLFLRITDTSLYDARCLGHACMHPQHGTSVA
jgi:hypothetical protein